MVMSSGPIFLKPGFRVSRWHPGFNPDKQNLLNAQVWVRIFYLPIEHRRPQALFNIASAAGSPLKIDPRMLSLEHGLYARVLIDMDF